MSWLSAVMLALNALWRSRTRAMLTALGVVIGVASVIAMVSVGAGAQKRIAAQLASMGTNSLVVRPGSVTRGGVRRWCEPLLRVSTDCLNRAMRVSCQRRCPKSSGEWTAAAKVGPARAWAML